MKIRVNLKSYGACITSSFLAIALFFPCQAQDTQQETPTPQDDSERTLGVRLVALGHRRMAQFTRSKEPKVVKIKAPDGTVIKETIPAGVPLEVMGKEFEYVPPLVYLPNRRATESGRVSSSPLILNACTQEQEISYRSKLDILLRRHVPGSQNQMELSRYLTVPVGDEQSNILVAIINRPSEKEGWKNPATRTFDTSPNKLPGGSLLVFNGTPFNMEVEMPLGQKFQTITIKPLTSQQFKPNTNNKGRTVVKARLVAKNGSKKQFFYNSLRLDNEHRAYLFSYYDPRREAVNPAGMVQFQDELKQPQVQPSAKN